MSVEEFYATRKRGRSKGVLHADRDCPYIRDIPDKDIIDRPRSTFDPDQEQCTHCFSSGGDVGGE